MQTVMITGGSRGLGFALAGQFLKKECKVSLLARDFEELKKAKELLAQKYPRDSIMTVVCDVTDEKQMDGALHKTFDRFGPVDTFVNNAGAILVGPFRSMEKKDFEAQMQLHFYAVLYSTQLISAHFRSHGIKGRIVNICSMGGKTAVPHMLPYDTSKFALAGFSQGVTAELATEGISVTTVYPDLMRTGSPIQAVFKGDCEKEFAWFAAGDSLPFLSMSADLAAQKIVSAAQQRKSEVVLSLFAQFRLATQVFLPQSFAKAMAIAAALMPEKNAFEYKTGAQSRTLFDELPGLNILSRFLRACELKYNQSSKSDARFNLGLEKEEVAKSWST